MLSLSKAELRRLTVFGVIGTLNTAFCYLIYAVLVDWAFWHYTPALVADYVVGAATGYVLHRLTTFNDRSHVRHAFAKYALMLAVTFALNWALLDALVRNAWLGPLSAQALATVIVTIVGYLMQTHWVFRSHGATPHVAIPHVTAQPGAAPDVPAPPIVTAHTDDEPPHRRAA